MQNTSENIPSHVALIPDGNRRWARSQGLNPWDGHEVGAKNFEKILTHSLERGVQCLSIWGSSTDNLAKRPTPETRALLDIYRRYIRRLLDGDEIDKYEVRVNVLGMWEEQFPLILKRMIREIQEKTKNYKKKALNLLLAYSGTDEMVRAIQKIHDDCKEGTEITAEIIKDNLFTKELPAVDLLIRTGGEPHNSTGFMMWDTANAQYFFSKELFPNFDEKRYEEAIVEYSRRMRRFGA
jgi:undecaprenyl diphosphate synthase